MTATSEGGEQVPAEFTWFLIDPCGPPENVSINDLDPIEYTITTGQFVSNFPDSAVAPTFCPCRTLLNIEPPVYGTIIKDNGDDTFTLEWYDLDIVQGSGRSADVDIIFTAICGT